jgi:hypothetical protein
MSGCMDVCSSRSIKKKPQVLTFLAARLSRSKPKTKIYRVGRKPATTGAALTCEMSMARTSGNYTGPFSTNSLILWFIWFCYTVYNSPMLNGFINCTLRSIIVVITLGKCAHRTPTGVRERHKCIGLI